MIRNFDHRVKPDTSITAKNNWSNVAHQVVGGRIINHRFNIPRNDTTLVQFLCDRIHRELHSNFILADLVCEHVLYLINGNIFILFFEFFGFLRNEFIIDALVNLEELEFLPRCRMSFLNQRDLRLSFVKYLLVHVKNLLPGQGNYVHLFVNDPPRMQIENLCIKLVLLFTSIRNENTRRVLL